MIGKNDTDKGATSGSCRFCFGRIENPIDFSLFTFPFSLKFPSLFKRSPFGLQKGSFWVAKGVLLESKRSPFRVQKESFLENNAILSGKQCNLACFSIWI